VGRQTRVDEAVISTLRSLGLTIKEIDALARVYLERPGEPISPCLAAAVGRTIAPTPRRTDW
jgi:hypothetical protein